MTELRRLGSKVSEEKEAEIRKTVADKPADVAEAVATHNEWLQQTDLPKLLFHANSGVLVTESVLKWCAQNLKNLRKVHIGRGTHFLQEENPHLIGSELAGWYRSLAQEDRLESGP